MMQRTVVSAFAAATLGLSGCGGTESTEPTALINLTEAQVADMMEALAAVSDVAGEIGFGKATAGSMAAIIAAATITTDETEPCPAGGNQRMQGTVTFNDDFSQLSMAVTQTPQSCAAVSGSGTTWTFTGAPNIVSNLQMSTNESTGVFTLSGTQIGALEVSSTAGSGRCPINITMNLSGSLLGTVSGSVTGTVCGQTFNETIDET